MQRPWRGVSTVCLAGLLCLAGCAGSLPVTKFTNPNFDFSFLERVAVLPFENLSSDRQAGFRATRLMITELLASGAVDVVEPGEVQAALLKLPDVQPGRAISPSTTQIVALGKSLRVQALILGSVPQSELVGSGAVRLPVVTLDVHMVETETGATVWAATHTERAGSVAAKVLGTGGKPLAETTRRCVKRLLKTLVR